LKELNGTPHEVLAHAELMELIEMMLPIIGADFQLCSLMFPRPSYIISGLLMGG